MHRETAALHGPGHRRVPHPAAVMVVAAIASAMLLVPTLSVKARAETPMPTPEARDASACREQLRTIVPFVDVAEDATHAEAIACLWVYGIATGEFADPGVVFDPGAAVTREQMASLVVRTLNQLPRDPIPWSDEPPQSEFEDADRISGVHLGSVVALTDLGIVQGYADNTFRPAEIVDRAQMAAYLARTIEEVVGEELDQRVSFDDVSGTHQASIEKLATIGVVQGTAPGVYQPAGPIQRQQLASLLTRTLSYLVDQGLLQPLAFKRTEAGTMSGLVDVDTQQRAGNDAVTLVLGGDDGRAGWRVRYVHGAFEDGSGAPVEVAGDAVLEVRIEGMAMPFDLPPDVRDALWDEQRLVVDGPAVVEVVDSGVFEGEHQLFIGTRGLLPFEVASLDDPARILIEVEHPS